MEGGGGESAAPPGHIANARGSLWSRAASAVRGRGASQRGGAARKPGRPVLSAWDQDPINKKVIQRGMLVDPLDRRLVRT